MIKADNPAIICIDWEAERKEKNEHPVAGQAWTESLRHAHVQNSESSAARRAESHGEVGNRRAAY